MICIEVDNYNDYLTKPLDIPFSNTDIAYSLQANSVNNFTIADASISTSKVLDSSITTAKLQDGSITYDKLAAPVVRKIKKTLTKADIIALTSTPYQLLDTFTDTSEPGYIVHSIMIKFGTLAASIPSEIGFSSVGATDKLRFRMSGSSGTPSTIIEVNMVGLLDTPSTAVHVYPSGTIISYSSSLSTGKPIKFEVFNPGDGVTDGSTPGVNVIPDTEIYIWYSNGTEV